MAKKTVCPISRAEFRGNAKPTSVTIAGSPLVPIKRILDRIARLVFERQNNGRNSRQARSRYKSA